MFETLLVKPIFNVLTFIYVLLPGHNFGFALIIFTILVKLALWPLLKKQLHHTKAMRALQPELKKIKIAAKGDRQKEAMLTMALYKEREVSPFAPLGLMFLQLPILIALYSGISRIVKDPNNILNFSYDFVRNMSWMKELATDISKFDMTLFGAVDLKKAALSTTIYLPGLAIVALSAYVQYRTSKQVMVTDKNAKKLKDIFKEAKEGKQADSAEMTAATSSMMIYTLPILVSVFTLHIASALSFYLLISGLITYLQQSIIFNKDAEELAETTAKIKVDDSSTAKVVKAEVISKPKKSSPKNKKTKGGNTKKKRR